MGGSSSMQQKISTKDSATYLILLGKDRLYMLHPFGNNLIFFEKIELFSASMSANSHVLISFSA